MKKKNYYVVEVFNENGLLYDSACLTSVKACKQFLSGSSRATITKCTGAYYDGFNWCADGDICSVLTGRKRDEF